MLEEVTEQKFHRMFDTNVLGMIFVTPEAIKQFGPEGGSIINNQLRCWHHWRAERFGLQRHQRRGGRNHQIVSEGVRAASHPHKRSILAWS